MIGALFTHPTGPIDGALAVRPFISEHSHGFELFDPETGDVAAIIHDGADRGSGEAQAAAEVLAAAPVMLTLLFEGLAIYGDEFDGDLDVNGGDLVASIAAWRQKVISTLQCSRRPPWPRTTQHDPGRKTERFGSDPIVVAYGAGVDSTAMLIGLRDRRIPVGLILFADTGSENPETYASCAGLRRSRICHQGRARR